MSTSKTDPNTPRPGPRSLALAGCAAWLLALAACGGGAGSGLGPPADTEAAPPMPEPPLVAATPAERAGCSVTLEGDSILYGGFVPGPRLPETPAALLHRLRPAYTVVDNSVPALTAALRARPFAAERRSTRFVVLQHGINDAQNATALAPPLRRMVERVQAEGRVPVVTGLARQFGARKVRRRDAYDATAREVARSRGALFADWGAVEGRPEEMADWIHPGTPYSARLVERLVAVLDAAAPECAQGPLARADRILSEPSP